ncbi:RNA methyltransferase [Tropicimonas sp. S265A]|uniref:RNA methyltransferase n=1 Tax=Tropicimonas sp. S265A TaxID=3415134 RepID=UPI003C79E84B
MSVSPPDQPAFVLVRPQMGENIGAAARAMFNFGLTQMRVTAPRDGWPNERAVALASGAGRILDNAGIFNTTRAALREADYIYATTARPRELTKPVLTPERAMAQARALIDSGQRVAVLFGPERAGLENDDIAPADAIISVPVNPDFPSLNLAQCVLLVAYEWRRQGDTTPPEIIEFAKTRFASGLETEKLGDHFEERLTQAGFFHPPDKIPHMKTNLRNMLGRLPLTLSDVQTFHGMLRQFARWQSKSASASSAPETDND